MSKYRRVLFAFALACGSALFVVAPGGKQTGRSSRHPGLQLLRDKCFQCHTDAMWRDARQDARWWEGALYRMVGRGGIWSTEEIKLMADYLGTDFGPNAKPPEPAK